MAYLGKSPTEVFRAFSVKDTFTGDGSTTVFTLSRAAFIGSPNDVQVFVDNVRQEPGSGKAYTIGLDGSSNATQLTFTAAPPSASEIYVIISAEPTSVVVPADGSVTTTKIADGSITSAKIADGTVIAADVGDGVITGTKLATNIAISTSGNITTTGAFTSTGIDDNATSTAITIDSSQNVDFVGTVKVEPSSGNGLLNVVGGGTNSYGYLRLTGKLGGVESYTDIYSNYTGTIRFQHDDGNELLAVSYNGDISFYEDTGTTAKFFWDASTERLGIGTSSPSSALDIIGGLTVDGNDNNIQHDITRQTAATNASRPVIRLIAKNTASDVTDGFGSAIQFRMKDDTADVELGAIGYIRDGADGSGAFAVGQDSQLLQSSPQFIVKSSGNVGIGTSTPNEKLQIHNTLSGSSFAQFTNLDTGSNDDNGLYVGVISGGNAYIGNRHSGDDIIFQNDNTEVMRIKTGGNVGIGTSSPTKALDVRTQAVIGDGTDGVLLTYSAGNSTGIIDTGFTSTGLEFRVENSPKMRLTTSGNLGIGTTSPDYKLQVDGDIVPEADNTYDLGKSSLAWANIYTGDLHLSNEAKDTGNSVDGTKGNWTIQEGENDLYIINNKNGKKYKFNLEEIN